jgi:hypothetical protein
LRREGGGRVKRIDEFYKKECFCKMENIGSNRMIIDYRDRFNLRYE